MTHLRALILERDQRTVLQELGRLGVLQPTLTHAGNDTAPLAPRDHSLEVARCEQILRRIDSLHAALPFDPGTAPPLPTSKMTLDQAETDLNRVEAQARELLSQRQCLLQRSNDLARVREQLATYSGFGVPLDQLDQLSFLFFVAGTLPPAKLGDLQKIVADNVVLLPLPGPNDRQTLVAVTSRAQRSQLETALRQLGFQREEFPGADGLGSKDFAREKQREEEAIIQELKQSEAKLLSFSTAALPALADLRDFVQVEQRLLDALQNFPRTGAAVLLTGWMPATEVGELEKRLLAITQGRCVLQFVEPRDLPEEEVPVLLRHGPFLRPFQMLLAAFGLPGYREIEPTLFMAISFLIMFGMMFGDVGHGAVLVLLGVAALVAGRRWKLRHFGMLFLCAGLSSMGFGFMSGSCFGLPQFKKHALWHDPIEGDPLGWIYAAILFGVILLSLGLILNIINRFRRGDVLGAWLDKFGIIGLVFYWGGLALVIKSSVIRSEGMLVPAVVAFVVLPFAAWILKEPVQQVFSRRKLSAKPNDNLFVVLIHSAISSFEAVLSYVANTISFIRLAAYAMSHAALVLAILLLAAELKHFSVIGGTVSVLMMVIANLIAIAIEGVIASVQAVRLEFYEFFTKFFSASGRAFKPFRLERDTGFSTWKNDLAHSPTQ